MPPVCLNQLCCMQTVNLDLESSQGVPIAVLHNDKVILQDMVSLETMQLLRYDTVAQHPGAAA